MPDDLSPRQRAAETKRLRTRNKLLTAATVVFSEKGWQARMEDVAEQAGVGAATAYNHFPSKVDLVIHAFERVIEPYQERAERDIASGIDAVVAITRHISELARQVRDSYTSLTAAYLAAVADTVSTQKFMWPFTLDHEMKRMNTPMHPALPLVTLIDHGMKAGELQSARSAWEIGAYHTHALFWMVVTSPPKRASGNDVDVAGCVLNQMLPLLQKKSTG